MMAPKGAPPRPGARHRAHRNAFARACPAAPALATRRKRVRDQRQVRVDRERARRETPSSGRRSTKTESYSTSGRPGALQYAEM